MMQDYSQNQVDVAGVENAAGQAVRLLQVLNGRAAEVQAITGRMFTLATILPFGDYADGFRRTQEFLSFCDVIESKLENLPPATREPILHEVTAVKVRAFHALLKAMGAHLIALEKRDMINFFAQAVFLMQQDVLVQFAADVMPGVPEQLVPEAMPALCDEILERLKRLLDRCVDVPDFRFET
ncbi:MAG: hypothetical protein OJJ21_22785 [Ferrovibrio sp.]|uniref:hypothetical protein n=1 Tax=Ferrovibrio sp. TaxID=1917215 RepID=UPI002630647D|nr:hypothetical protein [Ferrovibrio sp.]MCW0236441.1 hypothetical protein [Ferrovibrio sp.]